LAVELSVNLAVLRRLQLKVEGSDDTLTTPTLVNVCDMQILCNWAWGSVALLVGRSPDQSPVVSLGIFSEASDKSMCPGSTQPVEMSTRIFLGVKAAGAYG
jgi:hypothetical protein